MLISTIIISLKTATDAYEHSKGFFIAVGLPFAKVGKVKWFHVIGSYILAILSIFQIMFSAAIQFMSFY